MKFSVATPTKNALESLKQCVGSVRGQRGVDCEHIIQDGCSTDGTGEWIRSQGDLVACVEADLGMYDAINRAWSKASGQVLAWLNSDEQYLPGTLSAVAQVFAEHPGVDFVRGNTIIVDPDGWPIAARREIRLSHRYIANTFLNAYSCSLFFRRSLWEEGLLRFDERYRYAGDMEMVLRLLGAGKHSLHVGQYLALFTFDGDNLSCHPQMLDETHDVQRLYGGAASATVRRAITVCRYVERLLNGCYRKVAIAYDYALDDRPTYRRVMAASVPGRYRTR
jgi:glycosyltransferase involved in cell wall biosynthesis